MAKPAIDQVRFASTTDGNVTYQVEPTAGLKNTGWTTGNKPAAQHHTWLFRGIHKWLAYLDELLGGATGVTETLKAGGLTATGAVAAATLTTTGLATLASEAVTGNATVGGTLVVTGAATLTGGVNGAVAATGAVSGASVSATGGVTGQDIHITSAHNLMVHASGGGGDFFVSAGGGYVTGDDVASSWILPIPATLGETMSITAYFKLESTTGTNVVNLLRVDPATGTVTSIASIAMAAVTTYQALSIVTNYVVVSGILYYLQFNFVSGGGTGPKRVFGLRKSWTR